MRTIVEIKKDLEVNNHATEEEEARFAIERLDARMEFNRIMKDIVDSHFDRLFDLRMRREKLLKELDIASAKNGPPNRLIG